MRVILTLLLFSFLFSARAQKSWYKVDLPQSKTCYFIDSNGMKCPVGNLDKSKVWGGFHEGLLCVNFRKPNGIDDAWGCLNDRGDTIIRGLYLQPFQFQGGLAKVTTSSIPSAVSVDAYTEPDYYCRYIDRSGDTLIGKDFEANASTFFQPGWAAVKEGHQWFILSRKGKLRGVSPDFVKVEGFSDGIALCHRINGYHVYIDTMAIIVLEIPNENYVGSFSYGLAPYSIVTGKFGLMNRKAQPVTPCMYDSIRAFDGKLAAVRIYEKWGFIDGKGKMVIKANYEEVGDFKDGLALVKLNGLYGFVDVNGKLVIPNHYPEALSFENGVAAVCNESKHWGYLNKSGHWILHPQFSKAEPFDRSGFAMVQFKTNVGKGKKEKLEAALIHQSGRVVWKSGGELILK